MTAPPPLFGGLRVVDLSTGIAGAYCAKLLTDVGCDVVMVEPPGGHPLRRWSESGSVGSDDDPDGALFRYLRTSQRSVVADAADASGRSVIMDLVRGAALVIESWAPGTAERLGYGIDALRSVEPFASLVSISAFGRGGSMTDRMASEFALHGWSGSISTRGTLDRPPLTTGGDTGAWMTGTFAALAAVTFLQQHTGRPGEHLDVSALEALMLTHVTYAPLFASYLGTRGRPAPRTIELPSIEPAKDGWVGFCTVSGQQFADFAVLVGHPEWIDDPDWITQTARQARADEFRAKVAEWTTQHTVAEIVEQATLFRIPVVPIGNGSTLPAMDHFVERSTFQPNPRGGFLQPVPPCRFGDVSRPALRPAPRLGEHTGAIGAAAQRPPSARPPWSSSDPTADKPLRGLRIADFTAYWAGPFLSTWCAAMGADVIHVESPTRPDGMRTATTRPPTVDRWYEWGPVFASANLGKRGIAVDLAREEGRAIARRLVAASDVVIENFSPRVMPGFGLGWDDLRAVRPDLIMVRMPAFGLSGPWTDRTGFAQTTEQLTGMAWRTGFPDGQPLLPRGACDPLAGAHAGIALMAALEHRRRTGRGQLIEATLVEAALNIAAEVVIEQSAYGADIGRLGNRSRHVAPQGCYPCAPNDREDEPWICISAEDDAQWREVVGALDLPFDAGMPLDARQAAHDEIDVAITAVTTSADRDTLVARLTAAGVMAAPVWPARCLDELNHPRERGFVQAIDHPVTGQHELWGFPVRPLDRPGWVWHERPAPTLGQHNDEVLRGVLGMDEAELDELRTTGVVGERWIGA